MGKYATYLAGIGILVVLAWSCKHGKHETKTGHPKAAQHPNNRPDKNGTPGEQALHDKLGLSEKEIHHDRLYRFVNDWYGVPYKYGGCKKEGVDCSCFAGILYTEVYQTVLGRTTGEMFKSCEQIPVDEARKGDLFFFKINGDKISHVGICLNARLFVHASTSKGVMINSIDEAYYKKYFYCAGRIKKS
jgi:lipoprotein Spr